MAQKSFNMLAQELRKELETMINKYLQIGLPVAAVKDVVDLYANLLQNLFQQKLQEEESQYYKQLQEEEEEDAPIIQNMTDEEASNIQDMTEEVVDL